MVQVMAAELEGFVQSLSGLSAAQLMEKKDAIERDMKEFNEVLQTVSARGGPEGVCVAMWFRC